MTLVKVLAPTILVILCAAPVNAGQRPSRAIYEAVLPDSPSSQQVASVEIAIAPSSTKPGYNWHQLTGTKVNKESFTIWFLADANPFSASPNNITFHRYILQEPNNSPLEYIDQRTGKALLPLFHFVEELLPRAKGDNQNSLFERGTYLGHPLIRKKVLRPEPLFLCLALRISFFHNC